MKKKRNIETLQDHSFVLQDIIVLVADKDIAETIKSLFQRHHSLGIRPITSRIILNPQHDPGCLRQSSELLRPFLTTHNYAMVIFDKEGCGRENDDRIEIEAFVEKNLAENGWKNNSAVIVNDPEIENWVWSPSPILEMELGWKEEKESVWDWLKKNNYDLNKKNRKPIRPKEAMLAALKHVKKPPSSSIFRSLGSSVSFAGCTDPAFQKMLQILQKWFPKIISQS